MLESSYELLETFNVDILKLDILALGHARKLKFSSYVHLPSMNQLNITISSLLSDSVQCRRDLHFLAWALHLSF